MTFARPHRTSGLRRPEALLRLSLALLLPGCGGKDTPATHATTETDSTGDTSSSTTGEPTGPEDCKGGEVFVPSECSECGPADECISPRAVCRPSCSTEFEPCEGGGVCFQGACVFNLCG
jgi:hypothetical protein